MPNALAMADLMDRQTMMGRMKQVPFLALRQQRLESRLLREMLECTDGWLYVHKRLRIRFSVFSSMVELQVPNINRQLGALCVQTRCT